MIVVRNGKQIVVDALETEESLEQAIEMKLLEVTRRFEDELGEMDITIYDQLNHLNPNITPSNTSKAKMYNLAVAKSKHEEIKKHTRSRKTVEEVNAIDWETYRKKILGIF